MTEQQPSVGRIVVAGGVPVTDNNGTDIAPAVITRVWQGNHVNVRVLLDGNATLWWTSVPLFDSVEAFSAAQSEWAQQMGAAAAGAQFHGVYWPTRV